MLKLPFFFSIMSKREQTYPPGMKRHKRAEETNPCYKEHQLSLKCIDESGYKRELCKNYFDNYNECRAFWNFVYSERKRKGIKPYLTPIEDRPLAKQEYLQYYKK